MTDKSRRDVLRTLGGVAVVGGLAGCSSNQRGSSGAAETETATPEPTETSMMTETETATPEPETASLRVAHLSPDAPAVDVSVDGSTVLEGVTFGAVSAYLDVPVGTRTVQIAAADDPSTVAFEGDLDVTEGTFTVAAVGELAEDTFEPLVLSDDNAVPADDTTRVRVVHASPDAPAVDITAGGDALFDGVAYGESGYVEVPAGTYTLNVRGDTESNDGESVASFDVELVGGTVYTIFAAGYLSPDDEPAGTAFGPIAAVDAGAGGGGIVQNMGGMDGDVALRVAHLSPDAPNVDVLVDGSAVLEDVPFGAVSDYLSLSAGSYQVTVQAAGDPSTVVFDQSLDLQPGAYTAAAIGELDSEAENGFTVSILTDDTSAPADDTARLQIVHASPDAPAVDITVESTGDVLVDGAAFGDAATVEVPAGSYTLEVRGDTMSNDGDVVTTFDVTVEGGTSYTAFAQGYLSPGDEPADAGFDLGVVTNN
ncbi:DUF4397 domain-containing protein [Salinigranum sp. GCM10025319]|uniref:DUF4397 domain-containing protein n=1 Tax=Salinigranum sp. GCM10025319 TaxID=3252687 RepID=UPI0036087FF8